MTLIEIDILYRCDGGQEAPVVHPKQSIPEF